MDNYCLQVFIFIARFGPPRNFRGLRRERSSSISTDSMQELSGNDLYIEKSLNF